MGALPVVHGESASSVITRLNVLAAELKKSLRLWALGPTQVIILPPIVHLGDENLALHQSPASRTCSKLALTQLTILQRYIESRTSEMLGGMTRSPIHMWGDLASYNTSEMTEDSIGAHCGEGAGHWQLLRCGGRRIPAPQARLLNLILEESDFVCGSQCMGLLVNGGKHVPTSVTPIAQNPLVDLLEFGGQQNI